MGILGSAFKVVFTAAAAAGVAAVVSAKTAPEDPTSKRYRIRQYLRDADSAGRDAKATKEAEIIAKFQGSVNDYDALRDVIDHSVPAATATIARSLPTTTTPPK